MSTQTKTARIADLVGKLTAAAAQYYNDPNKCTMSDAEFDTLKDELEGLDPTNAFLSQTGAPATSGFVTVKHARPMDSLLKTPNPNGFKTLPEWAKAAAHRPGELLCITDKLDGFSLNLIYDKGIFVQAIMRGDGTEGDDITVNAKLMDFPKRLPGAWSGSIRAEGIIKLSTFKAEFVGDKNPRNTASGTARRQSDPAKCKFITCVGFDVCPDSGDLGSKSDELALLGTWGFDTPKWQVVNAVSDVESVYQGYIATTRKALDYWIDGLVICFDDRGRRQNLPQRNSRPLGAVAYKFPAEEVDSTLIDIDWSVGKGGRITPVLIVDSVFIGGSDVSRPNCHNLGYINELASGVTGRTDGKLYVGDRITVSKRNDVIPYPEACYGGGTTPIETPTECPACGHTLEINGAYLECNGDECPRQIVGNIRRWVEKIGVLHIGRSYIAALIEADLIEDAADLYTVDRDQVRTVTMGQRVVGNGLVRGFANLDKVGRELDLAIFVGSLGIPGVDRSTCQKIVEAGYDSLDLMLQAQASALGNIPGVGSSKAASFVKGFWERTALIGKLLGAGVTIKRKATGQFSGMTALVTGFRGKDEQAIVQAFTAEGGVMKSSVSKALTYLICKDTSSGSGKPSKARALNGKGSTIQIIDIDDFWANVMAQPRP